MNILKQCLTAALLLLYLPSFAQNFGRGLKIGDKVPNIQFSDVRNYPNGKAKLSDLSKGKKLIIFDFWNRFCSSCIKAMPEVQHLQEKFNTEIQIIYVLNPRDAEQYDNYVRRFPNVRNLKLPSIVGDSVLYNKFFPHQGDPYQVWLDENLHVFASTDQVRLTEDNVKNYLNGLLKNLPPKTSNTNTSLYLRQDYRSILQLDNRVVRKPQVLISSTITKAIEGFTGDVSRTFLKDSTTKMNIGFRVINATVKYLYEQTSEFGEGDILIKSRDSLAHTIKLASTQTNLYCYESILPKPFSGYVGIELAKLKMRSDLNLYFNLKTEVEKIPTHCLVFSITDTIKFNKLKSREKKVKDQNGYKATPTVYSMSDDGKTFIIKGGSLGGLAYNINQKLGKRFYLIYEQNNMPIETIILSDLGDIPALQRELIGYGIQLTTEIRPINFLVIRDI